MPTLTCVSPIDGSVYAERETDSTAAMETMLAKARAARREWARRPVGERVALVGKGIEALAAMNDEIVVELAHQMGRPVRYGGEIGGVRERSDYMLSIAERELAPVVVEDSGASAASSRGNRRASSSSSPRGTTRS